MPGASLSVGDEGAPGRLHRRARGGRARSARRRATLLARGGSATVRSAGRQCFLEAYPVRPRLVVVGAVQVAIARAPRPRARLRDGRRRRPRRVRDCRSASRTWTGSSWAGRTRSPTRSASARPTRSPSSPTTSSSTSRRSSRRCGAAAATSARSVPGRRRRTGVPDCARPGVTDAELARLRGPIGLDLGGRAPAETALAIMAEIVAERYGGSGAPLRVPGTRGRDGVIPVGRDRRAHPGRRHRLPLRRWEDAGAARRTTALAHVLAAVRRPGWAGSSSCSDATPAVLAAVRGVDATALDGVLVVVNPAPERGLATSLAVGFGAGTRGACARRRARDPGRPAARAPRGPARRVRRIGAGWDHRRRAALRGGRRTEPGPAAPGRLAARCAAEG